MRSLLGKYFITNAALILLSFIVLGGGLFWQTYNYSIGEKRQNLQETAEQVSALTTNLIQNYSSIQEHMYQLILSGVTDDDKLHVLVTDAEGNILVTSDANATAYAGISINQQLIDRVLESNYYSGMNNLDGVYKGQNYTVALPFQNHLSQNAGCVFVTTSMASMRALLYDIAQMFLMSALLVFLIAAFLSYVSVRKMTRPLKQISTAAKSFARGDYKSRVPVTSDDEIGELTCAFNNMADSIEKSEELRRTFVANVSHELRSPMTSIGGFVDGILDGTIPPDRERHYLEIISSEVRRLSRLVSRMLDITRLQAKDMTVDSVRFDFCELVRRVIISFDSRIEEKHLTIDIQLSEYSVDVFANEDAIYQVIYNLTDNAIKFSEPGSPIVITVNVKSGKLWFFIRNQGPTIPADQLPYVFDRFHKTDRSRANDKSGLGLGLYIVKTIVNQHKGDIGVKSIDGKTEFYFSLPLDAKTRRTGDTEAQTDASAGNV